MEVDKRPATSSSSFELPWVEKYRPSIVKDIVGNTEAVSRLQIIAEEGNMPNLILAGPPGTGKTTSIHCVAHELLGEHYKEAVLELNASDDRGIDVVRHKIKNFAQQKVTLPPGRHKIVILDEADSMTSGAQQALRRTMEVHSDTTRFALACNTSSKIIEPIQSRCAVVRYGRLGEAEVLGRLIAVATAEGVSFDEAGVAAIVFVADGDMRAALNALQATARGPGVVTQDNVFKVCDQPHPALLREIVSACLKTDIELAYRKMQARMGCMIGWQDELYTNGFSSQDIITILFRVVRNHSELDNEFLKLEYIKQIGFCHMRIAEGVASRLQISGLLAELCSLTGKSKGR